MRSVLVVVLSGLALYVFTYPVIAQQTQPAAIDVQYGRQLMEKFRRGKTLTSDEQAYLDRVRQEIVRRQAAGTASRPAGLRTVNPASSQPTTQSTGMIPLDQMTAEDRHKGQDGGLYGEGKNTPPKEHRAAAEAMAKKVVPLDANGIDSKDGKIVLVSIGISNTTMEFSAFKPLADKDPDKSPSLVIVDCAQGGRDALRWSNDKDSTWDTAFQRIKTAGATPQQVQIAWIKMVIAGPQKYGDFPDHAKRLQEKMVEVLQLARQRFPNLKLAFLSSRIYAGYAAPTAGSPEPYAYETAFAMRWLIQDQIKGEKGLNYDPAKGEVKAPLLLWGPYFWADGIVPRKSDGLRWKRDDLLARDGMHPSESGREKVAKMLLDFFKSEPYARGWFRRQDTGWDRTRSWREEASPQVQVVPRPASSPRGSCRSCSGDSPASPRSCMPEPRPGPHGQPEAPARPRHRSTPSRLSPTRTRLRPFGRRTVWSGGCLPLSNPPDHRAPGY
jgi:hypothetical protein